MDSWLTNDLRYYFGLQAIDEQWDILEIREGYFICLDGDLIRKRISISEQSYIEADVAIPTRQREVILPLTARGKEKKLNYTNISSVQAVGVTFTAGIREDRPVCYITASHSKNGIRLPLSGYKHLQNKQEIIAWLETFPLSIPEDYDQKLERLSHFKKKRHRTVPGEIFRVEIDLFTDGYVLVVGDLRKMEKDGLFADESIWKDVMAMPLFVRPYLFQTTNRSPELEEIVSAPLSERTWIVMDDSFMRGSYEHVGRKELTEEDIVFPIGYGSTLAFNKEVSYRLSWGPGTISKLESETTFQPSRTFLNHGTYSSIFEDCFGTIEDRQKYKTLDHPSYREEREKALAEFGFPPELSYDEFNERTGGLTRKQYLAYLSRTYKSS
ncbi:immunity 26/phosphotriesterase HocA family protein [Paenibacillus sp. ACRRY]|uniref:immunity 26/phosphotriesterase HocA family protein n=1 Tax=Paenibacillus sp. ACRRY TaxID=2918208 RepID=UPI001EF3EBFC|nr:immunity 26/phosphotriesterase HocA family protein [Paenibacillus sp. ACRRY]MCG7385696.1 immunity 26/phosphotriesterase HocA family protein [Paenibacillus sp. ACRRY]